MPVSSWPASSRFIGASSRSRRDRSFRNGGLELHRRIAGLSMQGVGAGDDGGADRRAHWPAMSAEIDQCGSSGDRRAAHDEHQSHRLPGLPRWWPLARRCRCSFFRARRLRAERCFDEQPNRRPVPTYFSNLREMVALSDVFNGLIKSFAFAVVIGVVRVTKGSKPSAAPEGSPVGDQSRGQPSADPDSDYFRRAFPT